jgi:hypothetical protein
MSRSVLGLMGLVVLLISLSACVTTYGTHLVSEDRNGLITFYREPLINRVNSDTHAQIYCGNLDQPFTWLETKLSRVGGYHDSYKCGAVPPAKMSVDKQETPSYRQEPLAREDEKQSRSISGDYFSSKRTQSKGDNW